MHTCVVVAMQEENSSSREAGTVEIDPNLVIPGADNIYDEEDSLNQIVFQVQVDNEPEDGHLFIAYKIDDLDYYYDMEPGFDFVPSLGEFPVTITMTIEIGETTSNEFHFQVLDDCHNERNEGFAISPVSTSAYTEGGTLYDVMDQTARFVIDETLGEYVDEEETEQITIEMYDGDAGVIYFEGQPVTKTIVPVRAQEDCGSLDRLIPIDATCTANILVDGSSADADLSTTSYIVNSLVGLEPDDEGFSITILDDAIVEPVQVIELNFAQEGCCPPVFNHQLGTSTTATLTIIDNDDEVFYGVVYPASIGRKDPTDINVYAVTTQPDIETDIAGNPEVCPYSPNLPYCKTTDLICEDTSQSFGSCTLFPKPKKDYRARFGSYVVSATYAPRQSVPVFVLPCRDVLEPLAGPTITINNGEDVVIGVGFSRYTHELRWKFNGRPLKSYFGTCFFEIKNAEFGKDDGYYEVYRVQRGDTGWGTIIRLIIRVCSANNFFGSANECTTSGDCICYNGGVCGNQFPDDLWSCICPLGFYGRQCEYVHPGDIRIGPPAKGLTCSDLNKDIPADCEGSLFCFPDPLGCLCPRGYWGQKCDRPCPKGRFGWSCKQKCNCPSRYDTCDKKTGICSSGSCKTGFSGTNCQQPIAQMMSMF